MMTTVIIALTFAAACQGGRDPSSNGPASVTLRVGSGQLSTTNPILGLRQLNQLLTLEGLARTGEDGRMQPWLAESWKFSDDRRALRVTLRHGVKFHDGAAADAQAIAALLPDALKNFIGPIYSDIESIAADTPDTIQIKFRQPSAFLIESLEALIQRPGKTPIGTGPYVSAAESLTALHANDSYYLGPPAIRNVNVTTYPSVRAAWAEMLRDRIDMLWEVGADALESMTGSTTASVFTYTRRYQYLIAFNPAAPALTSREVRKGLNAAIDRDALVRNALNTHGVASSGPISRNHWAFPTNKPSLEYDPMAAVQAFKRSRPARKSDKIQFTCLVPPDSENERVALDVKRQLEAVGVEMAVEELNQDQLVQRVTKGDYEAALIEFISGPTLLRPYLVWHSDAPINWGKFGNKDIDQALDSVRHAASDDEYRAGVQNVLRTFADDPPAIFLAWSQRARAVSKRFSVPSEPGRDILATIRLWKPAGDSRQASRN